MHCYSPLYIVLYYVSCIYALYFIKLISENQYVALFSRKLQHFICIFPLVLSLMIAGLLKLNYKDLWVSEDKTSREPEARRLRSC